MLSLIGSAPFNLNKDKIWINQSGRSKASRDQFVLNVHLQATRTKIHQISENTEISLDKRAYYKQNAQAVALMSRLMACLLESADNLQMESRVICGSSCDAFMSFRICQQFADRIMPVTL